MPKKRFNAFDDFPVEPTQSDEWQPQGETAADEPQAPQSVTAVTHIADRPTNGLFKAGQVLEHTDIPQVERIERLKPSQMMPDRFQPRRLLPTSLRAGFYARQVSCYDVARQWLQLARGDAGMQAQVDRLLKMGLSFEEHGQIKPITGSWVEAANGDYIFQIETGERRFWAACLQTVQQGLKEEPLLRIEVITQPTRMRQVLENRHAEPPSAVGQACEVASLILAELGITPTQDADEFDYFRRARSQRMPPGLWEKITPVMDLTRPRLVQLLNILSLPTPLLDLADRYRLPERVLREVLSAPREQWDTLIKAAIQSSLTSDDIAELTNKPRPQPKSEPRTSTPPDPAQQAINALKRFNTAMQTLDEDTQSAVLDELANDLVLSDQAETMSQVLRDLGERIRIRQQNRYRRR